VKGNTDSQHAQAQTEPYQGFKVPQIASAERKRYNSGSRFELELNKASADNIDHSALVPKGIKRHQNVPKVESGDLRSLRNFKAALPLTDLRLCLECAPFKKHV